MEKYPERYIDRGSKEVWCQILYSESMPWVCYDIKDSEMFLASERMGTMMEIDLLLYRRRQDRDGLLLCRGYDGANFKNDVDTPYEDLLKPVIVKSLEFDTSQRLCVNYEFVEDGRKSSNFAEIMKPIDYDKTKDPTSKYYKG